MLSKPSSAKLSVFSNLFLTLLDQRAEPEIEAQVKKLIEDFCGEECGYHKLRTRQAGARVYIDFHLQFFPETPIDKAHQLSHQLKENLEKKIPGSEVIIHLEPIKEKERIFN